MKNKVHLFFFTFFSLLLFVSCIKDTDFNQADDITVNPVIELDFIHFNISESDYLNTDTGEYRIIVTDTTELKFLDDDFSRENIKKADFYFKFQNTVSSNFITQFQFLKPNNTLKYQVDIPIQAGSINSPTLTEYTEIIENDDVRDLTKAEKVVINITVPESIENLEGSLNLQSKTTYFLEF